MVVFELLEHVTADLLGSVLSGEADKHLQQCMYGSTQKTQHFPHDNPLEKGQVETYRSRGSPNFL